MRWIARLWGCSCGAFSLRKFKQRRGSTERCRMAWAALCAVLLRADLRRELGLRTPSITRASPRLWCEGPLHMHTQWESELQYILWKQKWPPV